MVGLHPTDRGSIPLSPTMPMWWNWQTRDVEGVVRESAWRFDSSHRYQSFGVTTGVDRGFISLLPADYWRDRVRFLTRRPRGVAQLVMSACFGNRRSPVRVRPPRPCPCGVKKHRSPLKSGTGRDSRQGFQSCPGGVVDRTRRSERRRGGSIPLRGTTPPWCSGFCISGYEPEGRGSIPRGGSKIRPARV